MSSRDFPQRVFALQQADQTTVWTYGFGTYVGNECPPWQPAEPDEEMRETIIRAIKQTDDEDNGPTPFIIGMIREAVEKGDVTKEEGEAREAQVREQTAAEQARPLEERISAAYQKVYSNPRINLDNGQVIWGAQCWWGPEDRFQEKVAGRTLVEVDAPEENGRWK